MTAVVAVFWLGAFLTSLAFAAWDDHKHTRDTARSSNCGRVTNRRP